MPCAARISATTEGAAEEFQETAQKAKEICPISKLLNTEITLSITLL